MLTFAKLIFNVWYPIVVENETIIRISIFIDNRKWLDNIISSVFYLASSIILFQIGIRKIKLKWYGYVYIIIAFTMTFLFKTSINNYLAFILEFIFGIIVPIIYNIKNKTFNRIHINIIYPILINIFTAIFQFLLMYVRDIQIILDDIPTLIKYTLQLDYYIFLLITLLGVVYIMGNLSWWLFGKDLTKLKVEIEKEEKKENPDKNKILKIKERIKELEKTNV